MIANKCLATGLFKKCMKTINVIQVAKITNRSQIGNRDWVAFGRAGNASYKDEPDFPCPSIRFRENTNELLALREKEKGDWRKLTMEEKKTLYRASFRQTFSEAMAPTGQWKSIIGITSILVSFGLWHFIISKLFVYGPKPVTFSDEWRAANLRKMLDLKMEHLTGVSSKWDYEKDTWKK